MITFVKNFLTNFFNLERMIYINNTGYNGRSVVVRNGQVFIDGVEVSASGKQINIKIDSDIDKLEVDYCQKIDITGSVNTLSATSGDVQCGNVTNGIKTTSGDISCDNITGDVKTTSGEVIATGDINGSIETLSGDVQCGNVSGNVKTMSGDINRK